MIDWSQVTTGSKVRATLRLTIERGNGVFVNIPSGTVGVVSAVIGSAEKNTKNARIDWGDRRKAMSSWCDGDQIELV